MSKRMFTNRTLHGNVIDSKGAHYKDPGGTVTVM